MREEQRILMKFILAQLRNFCAYVDENDLQSDQEVLDFMDKVNEISVRY